MRKALWVGLSLLVGAHVATAAVRARYRIELRDGSSVISRDLPVRSGSVVLFHPYPGGALTSVPEEQVRRVVTGFAEATATRALRPGAVVFLGPTGGGQTAGAPASQPGALSTGVYDPRYPVYGSGIPTLPNGQPIPQGDLQRAVSGTPPTIDAPIGPNGFPATAAAPTIGPDGRPILASPGTPGSTPPAIGPNGTPVLAPPGAPGSTPPTIGPNGTPILAAPGTPGSTPPAVAPNGTPKTSGQ